MPPTTKPGHKINCPHPRSTTRRYGASGLSIGSGAPEMNNPWHLHPGRPSAGLTAGEGTADTRALSRVAEGHRPLRPRSPNTSASRSGRARRGGATAKAWWRRRPPRRRRHRCTRSAPRCPTQRVDAAGNRCTVADLAAVKQLRPVPKTSPIAVVALTREVSAQGLVSFRGSTYFVPPAHAGQQVPVAHRPGGVTWR